MPDLRYSLRVLRKSPAFTLVAVLTLMLGIGVNVVVFGVLNSVLLRPLGVTDPSSLYQLRHQAWMSFRLITTSYPAFEDFRRRNTTFSEMAAIYGYSSALLHAPNAVRSVRGDEVTGNYFDLLGVQPQLGRFFHAADEHGPGSAPYVVLSNALWRSTFNADPHILGTTVELNRHPFTVIGIASPSFHGAERFVFPDYWVPMVNQEQIEGADYLHRRTPAAVTVIGRLKPGVTAQQATDNLNAIAAALAREYPRTDDGQSLRLVHPGLYGDEADVIRGFLWGVDLLALLVLAAAGANLASLFAARAADRGRELALRVALGAGRWRLVTQLFAEAALVSLLGGAAGLLLAYLLLGLLNRWSPAAEAHLDASLDTRVYLVSLVLTLVSACLFAWASARQAWRTDPLHTIKGTPPSTLHLRRFALRDLLLGAQIAICTLLVVSSLVAVRGMVDSLHAPLGFEPHGVMLASVDLSQLEPGDQASLATKKAVLEAMRATPGVTNAGAVTHTPFTGGLHALPIFRPGVTEFTLKNSVLSSYLFAMSPGYLATARTRLLQGRDVSWHDTATTSRVAVVNETFARQMWGSSPTVNSTAIGKHFIVSGKLTEVVGVVETGKYHDLHEAAHPLVYLPLTQSADQSVSFVVRSRLAVSQMTAALQRSLGVIAPNAPVTLQDWSTSLDSELLPARAATVALGIMALLAVVLSLTGIGGMAAYGVSQRKKELGIRAALGARKMQVMNAALARPLWLLIAGSSLGLFAAVLSRPLLERIVYRANPLQPLIVAAAVLAMALIGIAASALPARRALDVDPARLMREE